MNRSTSQPPAIPAAASASALSEPPYKGLLGKTRRVEVSVTSALGRSFSASVFDQINVTADPHLRQGLLDGSLCTVTDPWTNQRYTLAQPVLVHQEALRLLALYLPESMRHQEFAQRRALLERMEGLQETLPAYVRRFEVVFGAQELARAEARAQAALESAGSPDQVASARRDFEERERQLTVEKQRLEAERINLEALKNRLQEQEEAMRAGRVPPAPDNEPTTVVPREVFFQVARGLRQGKQEAPAAPREPSWGDDLGQGWELEGPQASGPVTEATQVSTQAPTVQPEPPSRPGVPPVHRSSSSELAVTDDLPRTFNRLRAGSRPYYHDIQKDQLLLSYRLDEKRMDAFRDQAPFLFLQYHDLEEFPLVNILLAVLDEEGSLQDDIYWPLDLRKDSDAAVLQLLQQQFALRVALYGEDLKLKQVLQFQEPLELNARHLEALVAQRLGEGQDLSLDDALRRLESPDYERLGSMKHNFHQHSFNDLESPAPTRLAVGIVEYWSGPQTFRYLIENRSFSLAWFDIIQKRVIHAAIRFGVALPAELRRIAVDLDLAEDELSLARKLAATWAQTALGLGGASNDMDELDTWHNWQELMEAHEAQGASLDEELTNLASAALGRARVYSQANEIPVELPPEVEALVVEGSPSSAGDDLLSEIPGIEEARGLDEEALRQRLSDPDKRLAAAAALVDTGNRDSLLEVLVLLEEMTEDEVEALSGVLSLYAPRREEVYLDALRLGSPTITWICSFALASVPSQRGLETLLEMVVEGELDLELFGEVLVVFDDLLKEALVARLGEAGEVSAQHPLVQVLSLWAQAHGPEALDEVRAQIPEAVALVE